MALAKWPKAQGKGFLAENLRVKPYYKNKAIFARVRVWPEYDHPLKVHLISCDGSLKFFYIIKSFIL